MRPLTGAGPDARSGASPAQPRGRDLGGLSLMLALAGVVTLAGLLGWRLNAAARTAPGPVAAGFLPAASGPVVPVAPVAQEGVSQLSAEERSTVNVFRRTSPMVVNVTNLAVTRNRFSMDVTEIPRGTGSGFVWDDRGHIVTNFHVIQGSQALHVAFDNGRSYEASVVGFSADHDLAVLKLKDASLRGLQGLPLGRSRDLLVGQKVLAIGNPFGLDQTLTTGIISGLGREIRSVGGRKIHGVVQTDAAINPGNSGGPLLDSSGRLIGVNTAIVSPSGAYAGVGFAVPVDIVREVVPQLIARGRVRKPGLGVFLLSDQVSRSFKLTGVGIRAVAEDGAAARAGLRSARQFDNGSVTLDEIVAVNGRRIGSQVDLFDALDGLKVGDKVSLSMRRGREQFKVSLVLQTVE